MAQDANIVPNALTSINQIKINCLVSETGKFIAETEVVFAFFLQLESNGVILLSLAIIKQFTRRSKEPNINIKITTTNHLQENQ